MLKRWQDSPITRHYDFSNKRLWAKQEEVLWSVRKNKRTVVKSGNTIGKALDVDTLIYTTHGIKKLSEIKCGDYVYNEYGWKVKVDWVSDVNERECYKVIFDDRSEIIADKEHQWNVHSFLGRRRLARRFGLTDCRNYWDFTETVTTQQLFENCKYRGKNNYSIPLADAIDGWIKFSWPYTLGVWLGDGTRGSGQFSQSDEDFETIRIGIESEGFTVRKVPSAKYGYLIEGLRPKLRKLGVLYEKKIPEIIFRCSKQTRLSVLQGILDTDGFHSSFNGAQIDLCDEVLFNSTVRLIKTLGLKVWCGKKKIVFNGKNIDVFQAYITSTNKELFRLKRKSASKKSKQISRTTCRIITQVVPVGKRRVKCISVANKRKLYLAGESCIPTHNSFIAADVVMDWLSTHTEAKVITTAPTYVQVEEILWKEIRSYCFQSKIPIGVEPLNVQLKFNDNLFALGISTNETGRMQGFHSPHLLVVLDEASGISAEIWDTVEALHPERVLAIGNPLEASGRFYDCFQSSQWNKITISCEEAVAWQEANGNVPGLVTRDWIEDQKINYGTQSPWYKIHVLGEFPVEGEKTLISRKWVEDARKRVNNGKVDHLGNETAEDVEDEDERVVAADIATRHGENKTVVGYRYGHTISQLTGYSRISLHETSNKLAVLYNKKNTQPPVIDGDGVGEGMDEILDNISLPHITFHGGTASKAMDDQKFKNLRAQFYWIVARKFEKGLYSLASLPEEEYETLKNQLCAIHTKDRDPFGRFRIESKEDMQARGIKSPDHADCFVMMEFGYYMSKYSDIRPYKYK